jgi:TRAP-type mannitol/chloroaromatic compound transport system permease small subunit
MRIFEVRINSPAGVPIWPLKMMFPFGATLITLQGVAEVLRCIQCLKNGRWAPRLHDVEELENQILREAQAAKAEQAQAEGAKP